MSPALMEHPEVATIIPTENVPVLEEGLKESKIGGSTRGASITVVENPTAGGDIGYIFAERFISKPPLKQLLRVNYFRVHANNFIIRAQKSFSIVQINQGFKGFKYEFLTSGPPSNEVILRPSELPYEVCHFEPETYARLLDDMRRTRNARPRVLEINQGLSQRVEKFSLNAKGMLILPEDYAALTIKGARIPPEFRTTV